MRLTHELYVKQRQSLTLTPELHQAIMILQMNGQELSEFLQEETEKNPLLELVDEKETKQLQDDLADEEDWEDYFSDCSDLGLGLRTGKTMSNTAYQNWNYDYPPCTNTDTSIREHLAFQLGVLRLDRQQRGVAQFIIESIDDNGYLQSTIEEIAAAISADKTLAEATLRLIQGFDPPGVACRNLKECLMLQAKARNFDDDTMYIINHHLDDLGNGRYSKITRCAQVSLKKVLRARDRIVKLHPKPGSMFSPSQVVFVTPDITVKKVDEDFIVILNDSAVPAIRWNSFYIKLISTGDRDSKKYLAGQFKKARFLLKSIEQRRVTISRVMDCIVRRQMRFFRQGPGHLEPMILQDIAGELQVHASTVSRAVAGKYVDTPFGVFPCKMFFSQKVESFGREVSQYNIKKLIKKIISNEDPSEPLTDQQIVEKLKLKGIKIARRTAAKYRSQLGISASNRRIKL